MVMLEGKTLQEVAHFVSSKLATIDSILSTATHFVLKKYKDHGTIMLPETKKERIADYTFEKSIIWILSQILNRLVSVNFLTLSRK